MRDIIAEFIFKYESCNQKGFVTIQYGIYKNLLKRDFLK